MPWDRMKLQSDVECIAQRAGISDRLLYSKFPEDILGYLRGGKPNKISASASCVIKYVCKDLHECLASPDLRLVQGQDSSVQHVPGDE